ncbi:hypothetical protein [Synechococcus sp. BO 8801]|uniref:hypothetical protein n=1 Tax=Synechococcus sp. BO 8801 TaxID=169670 RepID=UPI000B99A7EC|nr:hypothetical protein [Synechococcus sp. BO 8801]
MGIAPEDGDPWFRLVSGWRIDRPGEFNKIVKEVQPSLIVIDSLGSVSDLGDAKENEGAYAAPLYDISRRNRALDLEDGFPAAAIIWIHHKKKDGSDFRGTDRLLNAVEETWGLRELTEEEEAEHGVNSRILTIGKSRFDRSRDRLLVTRDHNLNYEIKDLTATLHRMGVNRNGDLDPAGVVLEVLRAAEGPLREEEVREEVKAYLQAEGHDRIPKRSAVRKYLQGWVVDGMVRVEKVKGSGQRGQPPKAYSLACAGGEGNRVFIDLDKRDSWPPQVSAFLTRGGENRVSNRKSEERVSIPPLSPEDAGNTDTKAQEPNTDTGCVSIQNPCAATVPEDAGNTDTDTSAPHARRDGGPVPEGQTWGGPEGEETFIPAPPENVGLTDETDEDPWPRFD